MPTFKQKALEALRQSKNNSMECEGIEKAIMIVEDIEEDGWTPCSERLPEHLGNYLTQGECGVAILIFKPKAGLWTGFNGMHENLSVSKWMFLPPTN